MVMSYYEDCALSEYDESDYADELTKVYNEDGDEVDTSDPCWDCSGCIDCLGVRGLL